MSSEMRFAELQRLLGRAGWTLVRVSGSHHVFIKPEQTPISIPVHGKKVKPVYVAKVRKIIEQDSPEKPGA